MYQDYYELYDGKQAVDYIYKYNLGFSYGNAFKYCARASRKPYNSAKSDLNKALSYILSVDKEYSSVKFTLKKLINTSLYKSCLFVDDFQMSAILEAIIKFDNPDKLAGQIVKLMKIRGIDVNPEYCNYK